MECSDCEPRLIDHACQQLADDERASVARHLTGCPACALEYCRLQADLDGIVEAHAQSPRARVYHRLRRRVAAEVSPRPRRWARPWRLLLRPIPVYGAVLVALVPVTLWLLSAGGSASLTRTPDRPRATPALFPAATLTDYDAMSRPLPLRDVL